MLLTFADVLEPAAGYPEADDLLHPPPHRHRWHCGQCGRFVPSATVRVIPHWEYGYGPEQDTRGVCRTHGEVDVVWPEG